MKDPDDGTSTRASVSDHLGQSDELADEHSRGTKSRRGFLRTSAVAGSAVLTGNHATRIAAANQDDDGPGRDPHGLAFDTENPTDVDVLNYLLAVEQLEAAFYRAVRDAFSQEEFLNASFFGLLPRRGRRRVWESIEMIGGQETRHVDALTETISQLDGEPEAPREYALEIDDVADVFRLGTMIEATTIAAYAGAAPYIQQTETQEVVMGIHSVEARHAAVLNLFARQPPSPDAVDQPASQTDVRDAILRYVVS